MPTIKKQKHILAPGYIIYATCSRTGKLCFVGYNDAMTWHQHEAQVFTFNDLARAAAFRLAYKLGLKTSVCYNSEFLPTEIVRAYHYLDERVKILTLTKSGEGGYYAGVSEEKETWNISTAGVRVTLIKGNRANYRTKRPPVWPSIYDNPKQLF